MEKLFVVLAIGSVFLVGCDAQVPFLGKCPNVSIKSNFVPTSYLGLWYEYSKYFAIFQLGGKCTTATYGAINGTAISVMNRQRNILTNQVSTIVGYATLKGPPEIADLLVVFPSTPGSLPAPYQVLETDYNNFAVVFSCTDFGFIHFKFIWVLTRVAVPAQSVIDTAMGVLDSNHLAKSLLIKTDQVNCPADSYYG